MSCAISVIIAAHNAARTLGRTVDAVHRLGIDVEAIVVDAGSLDDTHGIGQWCGARVLTGTGERAELMNQGARAAQGHVVWFLAPGAVPPLDAAERILDTLADCEAIGGSFGLGLGEGPRPGLLKIVPGWAAASADLFILRRLFEEAKGFRPGTRWPERDLQRRLRRYGRFVRVNAGTPWRTPTAPFPGR